MSDTPPIWTDQNERTRLVETDQSKGISILRGDTPQPSWKTRYFIRQGDYKAVNLSPVQLCQSFLTLEEAQAAVAALPDAFESQSP